MKNEITDFEVIKAAGLRKRFFGFMFKRPAGYALLFENCRSVHTFFMRFELDIIFLDKNGNILSVKKNVKPWRVVLPVKNTYSILEIPSALNFRGI